MGKWLRPSVGAAGQRTHQPDLMLFLESPTSHTHHTRLEKQRLITDERTLIKIKAGSSLLPGARIFKGLSMLQYFSTQGE